MNRFAVTLLLSLYCAAAQASVSFTGSSHSVFRADVPSSTGLEAVYVLYNTENVEAIYAASSVGATVEISSFGNLGTAYATPVEFIREGQSYSFRLADDDCGFMITDNGRQTCFYTINYSRHRLSLENLSYNAAESDCARIALELAGNASPITYHTVTGRRMDLSRELKLSYNTLEYNDESATYIQTEVTETLASVSGAIHATQPMMATAFTLSGDRFLEWWNEETEIESTNIEPTAVDARTNAVQTDRANDNEQKVDANLGGSAPVDVTFSAAVTDAAIFHEWQFSTDPEFNTIDLRFNENEVTYTFRDAGTTYVRFVAANADASCEYISEIYEVFIGESRLECPNAFSPGSTPGVNDEWKVSYRSIVSFECHIFNRWGVKVATLNDASQGWNGRHGNKLVPAGVYYYVIKAKGADGRNYNLSGDINILNSNDHRQTSPSE